MPFTVTWTDSTGSQKFVAPDAAAAVRQITELSGKQVVKIVVKDNHNRTITWNDLVSILPPQPPQAS